jgi:hypothetical protein
VTPPIRSGPRREVDVAADAVWSLFATNMVRRDATVIVAAAKAAGVSVADLRSADARRARRLEITPGAALTTAEDPADGPQWSLERRVHVSPGPLGGTRVSFPLAFGDRPQRACDACHRPFGPDGDVVMIADLRHLICSGDQP